MRENPTVPLPDIFPDKEIGLLTKDEFLRMRDPHEKTHPSNAYDDTLASLNPSRFHTVGWTEDERRRKLLVQSDGYSDDLVFREKDTGQVVGVLRDHVMYRSRFVRIPAWYRSSRQWDPVAISFTERETKYPERLLETDDKSNRQRYGVVLRRFVIGGHRMELRAESQPAYDGMDTIVVLDGMGQIAARGDNEWGATLLRVAKEYRGIGLGRVLARAWYDINPSSVSGGFTSAGRRNAVSAWETRVREFLANGWYSALVRAGRMEKSRVDEILSGLSKKRPSDFLEMPADQGERRSLVYVDDDGIAFVLYDARFLDEPDEKWILAYGFLRESSGHGAYFYRMEYEPDVELVATAIALQLARDNGEQLYVGSAPGDMVPWELIPEAVEEHDGHIEIVRDLIPLRTMARQERSVRGPRDPYGQRRDELLELAESKWS